MYCKNCGNEIDKDSEFCTYCGEKVEEETNIGAVSVKEGADRQKKFRKGIIAAVIMAVTAVAVFVGVWLHNAPARRLAEQLDLGNRYLDEMDYEQAVVAFTKAIEIDPMSVDAYIGAAEAYVGLGNEDEAITVLEKGYELTSDEEILEMLEELREREGGEIEEIDETVLEENGEDALPYFELGFSPEDFTIAGYSVIDGNHIDDIEQEVSMIMSETPGVEEMGNYIGWSYNRLDDRTLEFVYCGSELWVYADNLYCFDDENYIWMGVDANNGELPVDELSLFKGKVNINRTSYEDALEVLGIKQIVLKMEEEGVSHFEFESQYGYTLCDKCDSEKVDYNIAVIGSEKGNDAWNLSIGFYNDTVSFLSIVQGILRVM